MKDQFLGHGLYISALEHVMKLILYSCVLLVFINIICKHNYVWAINYPMYEKCKFLSMGYISAFTHVSVLIWSKNVCLWFKVIAKAINSISYSLRYGLGGKAQLVRNLPCIQIFVIWSQASWQLTIWCFFKVQALKAKTWDQTGLVIYI